MSTGETFAAVIFTILGAAVYAWNGWWGAACFVAGILLYTVAAFAWKRWRT